MITLQLLMQLGPGFNNYFNRVFKDATNIVISKTNIVNHWTMDMQLPTALSNIMSVCLTKQYQYSTLDQCLN